MIIISRHFREGFEKTALRMSSPLKARLIEGLLGGAVGAGIGTGIGSQVAAKGKGKKDSKRNAIIGALTGGITGIAGGLTGSKAIRSIRKLKASRARSGDIPKVYYHGHPKHLSKKIRAEGLKSKSPSRQGKGSEVGSEYRDGNVFLTKDPTYAKAYGKTDAAGYYDYYKKPSIKAIALPQSKSKKIKNIYKRQKRVDLEPFNNGNDLSGVGSFSVDGRQVGMGSEYVHKGAIKPKYIQRAKESKEELMNRVMKESIKKRVAGEKIDHRIFGLGKK